MSNTAKIVLGAVVVAVLLGLAYSYKTTLHDAAPPEATDTSNKALEEDTASIDADLKGLDGDEAMIDQGLEEDASAE